MGSLERNILWLCQPNSIIVSRADCGNETGRRAANRLSWIPVVEEPTIFELQQLHQYQGHNYSSNLHDEAEENSVTCATRSIVV